MTAHLSPINYSEKETPGPYALVVQGLNWAEKALLVGKVLAYICGSFLFLFGSILFYPDYATKFDGKAALYGAWIFFVGCICFLLGTNGDFIWSIRTNSGTKIRQVVNAYNAMCYVGAAAVFQLGALYFLPDWYVTSPNLGCWAFIVGCVMFCWASFVDIVLLVITHEDPHKKGIDLKNLLCWGTLVAIGCFVGALYFILGSWFYLPKFIALADVELATHYMNKAINYYVIGSVFFIINAFAQVPDLIAAFKASGAQKKETTSVA